MSKEVVTAAELTDELLEIDKHIPKSKLRELVIFDLDGTLVSNDEEEGGFRKDDDWILAQPSQTTVLQELKRHLRRPNVDVAIVTGRPESLRAATIGWLKRRQLEQLTVMMRANGTPLALVNNAKANAVLQLVKAGTYSRVVAYDDNKGLLTRIRNVLAPLKLEFEGNLVKEGLWTPYPPQ
jgi:hypothetical protein